MAGKDLFTVKEKDPAVCCKAEDMALYKRPPDQYVLHRIIKVRQNDYVILGDNCVNKEYGIKDEDIIGVMTRYIRNGKEHDISEKKYRFYSFVWLHSIPLRTGCKKVKYRMKNLVRKIVKNEK